MHPSSGARAAGAGSAGFTAGGGGWRASALAFVSGEGGPPEPSSARASDAVTRARTAALVAFAGVLTVAFFFRHQILSGFAMLSGDRYDQVIEVTILEHWFNVLRGLEHWSETGYFYPFKLTLGYNDGYFLYGAIYSLFRAAGLDPYLAGECVSTVLLLVGFCGFYAAGRRLLDLRPGWAVFGAVLFSSGNNLFVQVHHAQLLGVCFVPVMAVLLDGALAALVAGRRARLLAWGCSAACFYAAWLLTAYYTAWYFAFFCTFAAAAYAALAGRAGMRALWQAARRQLAPLAAIGLVFVAAAVPFLTVYLPKARETGMHPYRGVSIYTLSLPDLLHVGQGNLLYGRLVAAVNGLIRPDMPAWSERMTGFPPGLLLLFAAGLVLVLAAPRSPVPARATALKAVAVATVATWALIFHVAGHSAWWFVYEGFPGARAARVVARYQIFLAVPVVAIAVLYLSSQSRRIAAPLLLLICALLAAEQVNTAPLVSVDRPHELARLRSVPPPPAGCEAFFAENARPEGLIPEWDGFYSHNVDAMLIAQIVHLPTINGASTFQPPNWRLTDPDRPDYPDRVRAYAEAHRVAELCALDLQTMRWSGPRRWSAPQIAGYGR